MQHTVLIFNAVWNDTCYYTYPLWCKLANKFSTDQVQFIELDVMIFDTIAKQFKVSLSGIAGQLPTLILFEDGLECLRFPMIDEKTGKSGYALDYREKELIKFFDLDKRSLATRDQGIERKKGST